MTIKGTEQMSRYPTSTNPDMRAIKGINHYGYARNIGRSVLKVAPMNVGQLTTIGYKCVGHGNSYAYVARNA